MKTLLVTNRTSRRVVLGIETNGEAVIVVNAYDRFLPKNFYIKRSPKINGYREIELKFPVTPTEMVIQIYNYKNGDLKKGVDPTFRVTKFEELPLNGCGYIYSPMEMEWMDFVGKFAQACPVMSCGTPKDPDIYHSKSGEFIISYMNQIVGVDKKTGAIVKRNTPASVGSKSRIIDVSKIDFVRYTVPMRVAILCHEYGHVYSNPKHGIPADSESGADINGLLLYLAAGYPESEAEKAFIEVFRGMPTEQNDKRMKIINKFVDDFRDGKILKFCGTVTKK